MSFAQPDYNPINAPGLNGLHSFEDVRELVRSLHRYTHDKLNYDRNYLRQLTNTINNNAQGVGPVIVSGSTITPTTSIHFVTGGQAIRTIRTTEGLNGSLDLIAADSGFALATGGNISVGQSVPRGLSARLVFNPQTMLWYPLASIAGATGPPGPPGITTLNILSVSSSPVSVPVDLTEWTYYRGDTTTGDIVFNLPRASGSGMVVLFGKTDASANAVVPTALPPDLINGQLFYTVNTEKSVIWLADADNGAWDIISVNPMS